MKKLMIAAAAAAMTAGAFAVEIGTPAVYDFKATVKHTYLKAKNQSSVLGKDVERGSQLYIKYTKSSKLKGYLIQDIAGVCTNGTITCQDAQPGNRCFLVVKNLNAEKAKKDSYGNWDRDYRVPRIIPGVLDVKWYNSQLKSGLKSLPAQAYLYLGGEIAVNTNTFDDAGFCTQTNGLRGTTFAKWIYSDWASDNGVDKMEGYAPRTFAEWVRNANELNGKPARQSLVGIDDYFFTSCFLFGKYNQPAWDNGTWKIEEFADCWMNCAGFGKVSFDKGWSSYCCGRGAGKAGDYLPDNLSGSLKAGFFLCTENGEDDSHSLLFARTGLLEDQLYTDVVYNTYYREDAAGKRYEVASAFADKGYNVYNKYAYYYRNCVTDGEGNTFYSIPRACADIWADGTLDLRTTDVGTGTWSLKYNTKAWPASLPMIAWSATEATDGDYVPAGCQPLTDTAKAPKLLINTVLMAAYKLQEKNATVSALGDVIDGDALMNKDFYSAYFLGLKNIGE